MFFQPLQLWMLRGQNVALLVMFWEVYYAFCRELDITDKLCASVDSNFVFSVITY